MAFLGLDLSTQSLSAVLIRDTVSGGFQVAKSFQVTFDDLLPQFGTKNGMRRALPRGSRDAEVVTSPVRMWILALERLCKELEKPEWRELLEDVDAISVSAQQHAAVYWTEFGATMVRILQDSSRWDRGAKVPLDALFNEQCFSVTDLPIWADSSSQAFCPKLEREFGKILFGDGAGNATSTAENAEERDAKWLADVTGSRAYARFTGIQIAAIGSRTSPALWDRTAHISLVSSFVTSLLIGDIAPVDESDAGGMNLLDIHTRHWSQSALEAVSVVANMHGTTNDAGELSAAKLRRLLGHVVRSYTTVGYLSPYFRGRLGMKHDVKIIAGSGDNCCTIAGFGLTSGAEDGALRHARDSEGSSARSRRLSPRVLVSLGTSDTALMAVPSASGCGGLVGHCFPSPIAPKPEAFTMLCYKNGGTLRERLAKALEAVPDSINTSDQQRWQNFSRVAESALEDLLHKEEVDFRLVVDMPEITPVINKTGIYGARFTSSGPKKLWWTGHSAKDETQLLIRSHVLGRFLSMRNRMRSFSDSSSSFGDQDAVLAAGGGARSDGMLQILADVFGCAVIRTEAADNAAALGAAIRAKHGSLCSEGHVPFHDAVDQPSLARLQGFAPESDDTSSVFYPREEYRGVVSVLLENYEKFESEIEQFYLVKHEEAADTDASRATPRWMDTSMIWSVAMGVSAFLYLRLFFPR